MRRVGAHTDDTVVSKIARPPLIACYPATHGRMDGRAHARIMITDKIDNGSMFIKMYRFRRTLLWFFFFYFKIWFVQHFKLLFFFSTHLSHFRSVRNSYNGSSAFWLQLSIVVIIIITIKIIITQIIIIISVLLI